jgi:hypothetical protein
VDWLRYTPNDRTWEPVETIVNAHQLLEEFHRIYLNKSGPYSCSDLWNLSLKEGDSIMSPSTKRLYVDLNL